MEHDKVKNSDKMNILQETVNMSLEIYLSLDC